MKLENESLVETLNDLGYNLVQIDDETFVFTEFVPATEQINKHRLVGKKINGLLQNFGQLTNITQFTKDVRRRMEQQLEGIKSNRREYSNYFEWITYLAD